MVLSLRTMGNGEVRFFVAGARGGAAVWALVSSRQKHILTKAFAVTFLTFGVVYLLWPNLNISLRNVMRVVPLAVLLFFSIAAQALSGVPARALSAMSLIAVVVFCFFSAQFYLHYGRVQSHTRAIYDFVASHRGEYALVGNERQNNENFGIPYQFRRSISFNPERDLGGKNLYLIWIRPQLDWQRYEYRFHPANVSMEKFVEKHNLVPIFRYEPPITPFVTMHDLRSEHVFIYRIGDPG